MFSKVLIAVDGSEASLRAARAAAALGLLDGAELHLAHAETAAEGEETDHGALDAAAEALTAAGLTITARRALGEKPGPGLSRLADEEAFELIVAGRHRHGALKRLLYGSTSDELISETRTPLFLLPESAPEPAGVGPYLVPFDFTPASRLALGLARKLARRHPASLTLFHAVPLAGLTPRRPVEAGATSAAIIEEAREQLITRRRESLQEVAADMKDDPFKVDVLLDHGKVVAGIRRAAKDARAALIVLASHGRRGLQRFFLGSVAAELLAGAERPLLVLPADPPAE